MPTPIRALVDRTVRWQRTLMCMASTVKNGYCPSNGVRDFLPQLFDGSISSQHMYHQSVVYLYQGCRVWQGLVLL